ncbi:MAG: histidine phosphatase family protein [Ardenticatenaceae bacterium]|nr:histidine phosphatase family protein [Ardenticatenaceae bacterium]
MTTLYLIRHGETPWNLEGRYQGQLNPPLTTCGRQQARAAAERLAPVGFDAIYSSDLARARQTAEALAELTGLPVQLDSRLREIHQGEWQGVLIDEIRARWPQEIQGWERDPWRYPPPGGECLEDVQTRLFEAVDEIVVRHPQGTVAVFTHKLPIALLKIRDQSHPAADLWSLLPAHCAWEIFEVEAESGRAAGGKRSR